MKESVILTNIPRALCKNNKKLRLLCDSYALFFSSPPLSAWRIFSSARNYSECLGFKRCSKEMSRRTFTFSIPRQCKKPRCDLLVVFQAREPSYFGKHNATNAIYAREAMCLRGAKRLSSRRGLPHRLVSSVVCNIFRLSRGERNVAVVVNIV